MLQSINPYTQTVISEYSEESIEEIKIKVQKSEIAFTIWSNYSFETRASYFYKLAEVLEVEKDIHATLITSEMGKPFKEAKAEIEKCILGIRYYAEKSSELLKPVFIESTAVESYLRFDSLGTILALMPWNFPYWQAFRCSAPAMMAGNTILLKSAPNTTGCALAIEACFQKAGFPVGTFQALKIQNETTGLVIGLKEIKAISLTGSERAGISVASEAGRNLKKVVLELGGSDPFIVLEDAPLNSVIDMAVKSRLQNAGQSCIAAKRFIVHTSVSKKFLTLLIQKIEKLKIGNPMEDDIDIGPMAKKELKSGLVLQVKKSIEMGAEIVFGSIPTSNDNLFSPIILTNIKSEMPAYREELFGPVFCIFQIENDEEALKIANDSSYGLGASIWTADIERAKNMAEKLESGMVFINDFVRSEPGLPFGGVKLSGYGRELGEVGIKEFVNVKTVYVK